MVEFWNHNPTVGGSIPSLVMSYQKITLYLLVPQFIGFFVTNKYLFVLREYNLRVEFMPCKHDVSVRVRLFPNS